MRSRAQVASGASTPPSVALALVAVVATMACSAKGGPSDATPDALADSGVDAEADSDREGVVDVDLDGDAEEAVVQPVCDVLTGDGCAEGEFCGGYTLDGLVFEFGCVPYDPLRMHSEPHQFCTGYQDPTYGYVSSCEPGYVCAGGGDFLRGICRRLCDLEDERACENEFPDEEEVDGLADGVCVLLLYGYDIRWPLVDGGVCQRLCDCDLLDQDCNDLAFSECAPIVPWFVNGCYPVDRGLGRSGRICMKFERELLAGDGFTGDPCFETNECHPGFTCFLGECRQMCALGEPPPSSSSGAICGALDGLDAGTCQAPRDHDGEPFLPNLLEEAGIGLCLETASGGGGGGQ